MARPKKKVDATLVRNMAVVGATTKMISDHCGVSPDTIERRFRNELTEGRSDGQLRILGRIFQAALAGQGRALELCAVNLCGWTLKPQVVVSVQQNAFGPLQTPQELRAKLLELHQAVSQAARQNGSEEPPQLANG